MDLEKMTDDSLTDMLRTTFSRSEVATKAFSEKETLFLSADILQMHEELARRLESLRAENASLKAENERSHNAESVLASVTDLLNTCAREHGVEEARSEEFVKGVIERIWFRSAHYRQQVTTLKAENAVMRELCEAAAAREKEFPRQSVWSGKDWEDYFQRQEREMRALEAYRKMKENDAE